MFATQLYATTLNPRKVQAALGHAFLATTERYLADVDRQELYWDVLRL
jgi:integrase